MAQGQANNRMRGSYNIGPATRPRSRAPHKGAYVPPTNMTDMEKFIVGDLRKALDPDAGRLSHLDKARLVNSYRVVTGVSAGVNAADVSMNNSPMWKDSSGHLRNPRTGRQLPHRIDHSHDVSVTNPPGY